MNRPIVLLEDGTLRSGGIRRYQDEVIRRLAHPGQSYRVVSCRRDRPVPPGVELTHVPAPRFLAWHRWVRRAMLAVRESRPRLVHILTQAAVRPSAGDPPIVMTVHDLAPLVTGVDPWRRPWFRWAVLPTIRRVDHVVTDSNLVARDVCSLAGIPATRVSVVQPGVGPPFNSACDRASTGAHVLVVGGRSRRKGSDVLDRASIRAPVVMAGHRVGPARSGRRIVESPSDHELARLYRDAVCVVIPSRHEGFGLPALEAMACGAPVVATAGGALPETIGRAGVLVPPGDPDALAGAVNRLLDDKERRDVLRDRGREWAANWSWERSVASLCEVWGRYR